MTTPGEAAAPSAREPAQLDGKLAEIENRAAAAQMKTGRTADPVSGHPILEVWFSDEDGRRDSRLRIGTLDRAEALLSTAFESFRSVSGYSAIFDPTTGSIEARIRPLDMVPLRERPPFDERRELISEPSHPGKSIILDSCSPLLSLLARPAGLRIPRAAPAVTFVGFPVRTPDEAKSVLDNVGTALMFELDLAYGVPLQIAPALEFIPRSPARMLPTDGPPSFPRNAYDPEPVALYMYGREARGMPLLQFLAYYQAVEFYFPRYSEAVLRRRLESVVKDPRFNPHRDRDIGRLLSVTVGDGRRAADSERDQLQATIRACLQADEIRDFVSTGVRRTAFFADRRSPLTKRTIPLRDQDTDPRDAAANRIYDLRCKIVHTKDTSGQGEIDLLLPNSPEARLLREDIALLHLIATRVIVTSSHELQI